MGRCESAIASIGLKILLGDLVSQITATNFPLIKEMLQHGFIEDENDDLNDTYSAMVDSITTYENFQSDFVNKWAKELSEQSLLVPIKELLSTSRWGYERCGINGRSRQIDFDSLFATREMDKYKQIQKTTQVFILQQLAG